MPCFEDYDTRLPITSIHTSEWEARHGAMCVCGGFSCVGIYGGICPAIADTVPCPCGCDNRVNLGDKFSYAYSSNGWSWANEKNPECLAAHLPPNSVNVSLFRGQEVLEETGTQSYSYEVARGEDEGVNGKLFYRDELIADVEDDMLGEVVALIHGEMMHHAASSRLSSPRPP